MTAHPARTYALRSAPIIALGCLAAAVAGAEVGWALFQVGGGLFSGKPLIDENQYSGVSEWLYALAFWGLFLLPGPLVGLFLIGWPALLVARSSRPNWVRPLPVYAIGFLAVVAGECLTTAPLVGAVSPLMVPVALLSSSVLGSAFAVPASLVFRLIVLRKVASAAITPAAA